MNSEHSTREHTVRLSPQGKPLSEDELRRTRDRLIIACNGVPATSAKSSSTG